VIPQKKIEIWTIQAEWISASLALSAYVLFGQAASVVAALLQERELLVLLRVGTVVVCLVTSEFCIMQTTWCGKCPAQALSCLQYNHRPANETLLADSRLESEGWNRMPVSTAHVKSNPFMSRPVFVWEGVDGCMGSGPQATSTKGVGCRSRMIALGGCWLPVVPGRRRKWEVKLNARHTAELFMQEHARAGAEYPPS
jgi:hypothetical protein